MSTIRLKDEIYIELGTEVKLNIHIEPIDGVDIDDYDYITEVYCHPKKSIVIQKSDTMRVDNENYVVRIDTNVLGVGKIICKVTAYIPDGDFPDGLRTEIVAINTKINVIKT